MRYFLFGYQVSINRSNSIPMSHSHSFKHEFIMHPTKKDIIDQVKDIYPKDVDIKVISIYEFKNKLEYDNF